MFFVGDVKWLYIVYVLYTSRRIVLSFFIVFILFYLFYLLYTVRDVLRSLRTSTADVRLLSNFKPFISK